ncbi:unnamed protein product [Ectocarpus sp. 12 AP-2014]
MKTMVPVTLGATLLGIHLTGNHQVDGFVVVPAGSSRPRQQQRECCARNGGRRSGSSGSSRGVLLQPTQRSSCSARSNTCRPLNAGFGQRDDSVEAAAKSSKKKGKGKKAAKQGVGAAGGVEVPEAEGAKGTGQRQLFMQFTCNLCEGVNQYMINKNAYEEGIVICTCQSCGARHLIADNLKKLDFPAFGNNIEEYMQSTGTPDEVTKGRAPDLTPEIVEKFDVAMGKDGVLTLSPKDGAVGEEGQEPPSS